LGPKPGRKYLRRVHPRDGPKPNREKRNISAHGHDAQHNGPKRLGSGVLENHGAQAQRRQRQGHPSGAQQQKRPPPKPVQVEGGKQNKGTLGNSHDDVNPKKLFLPVNSSSFEYLRAVVYDGVVSGGLHEKVNPNGGNQHPPDGPSGPYQ